LSVAGETPPSELTRRLQIMPNALSTHLAKLGAVGLITRRRSGAWSYCSAESPYGSGTFSGMTLAWLREVLVQPQWTLQDCGLHEVRNSSNSASIDQIYRLLFEAATAFTDLRRLQILRHLAHEGETAADTLRTQLHMSAWAVARHTDKLVRRGYLAARITDTAVFFGLAKTFQTPLHVRLWEIVNSTWQAAPLRTS
jgi:DNA-binding MarR family transcriptional regulator